MSLLAGQEYDNVISKVTPPHVRGPRKYRTYMKVAYKIAKLHSQLSLAVFVFILISTSGVVVS